MSDDGQVAGPYSTGMATLLWLGAVVGICGLHRFYLGQPGRGALYLVTVGLLGWGQIVDYFRMESLVENANSQYERMPRGRRQAAQLSDNTKQREPDTERPSPVDLQRLLLDAALQHEGELTVTQGAMATGKGFKEVESTLAEMHDKRWVDVGNERGSGAVVYRFSVLEKQPMLKSARTAVAQAHATVRGKRLTGIGRRQQQLLQAALQNGGTLTVAQGVTATGKGFEEVEQTLTEMSQWDYVDMDTLPDSGVVVYRFREMEKPTKPKSALTAAVRVGTTVRDAIPGRFRHQKEKDSTK